MPQVFKVGTYWVYFWTNENEPLEAIHVHVAQGSPQANATKIWITKRGRCLLCHNRSKIPQRILNNIMAVIESRSDEVIRNITRFLNSLLGFRVVSGKPHIKRKTVDKERVFEIGILRKSSHRITS